MREGGGLGGRRTPSQTLGPFFSFALPWAAGPRLVAEGTPGAVSIGGRVLDGRGAAVPDALIETWQLGPAGCRGFGRSATDAAGGWAILTVKPPAVRGAEGRLFAPHLVVSVFARGLLGRLVTRMYFADEAAANAADPLLARIDGEAGAGARASLIAALAGGGGYRFDIRLQGEGETVFFDV